MPAVDSRRSLSAVVEVVVFDLLRNEPVRRLRHRYVRVSESELLRVSIPLPSGRSLLPVKNNGGVLFKSVDQNFLTIFTGQFALTKLPLPVLFTV